MPLDCTGAARPCLDIYGSNGALAANVGNPTASAYRVVVAAKTTGNTYAIIAPPTARFVPVHHCGTDRGGCPVEQRLELIKLNTRQRGGHPVASSSWASRSAAPFLKQWARNADCLPEVLHFPCPLIHA